MKLQLGICSLEVLGIKTQTLLSRFAIQHAVGLQYVYCVWYKFMT